MRNQIRNLNQGTRNLQEGIDFANTAEGALNEVHNILNRIKELSVQAANDTNEEEDRKAINNEITQLKKEINNISSRTEFNGTKIFRKSYELNFSDNIQMIQIFDANNGSPTDPDSYGGIIVNGDTRIAWNDIDTDMMYRDADTGETRFKAGTYTVNAGSYALTIECKDGTKPPDITANFPIDAGDDGITIAGTLIPWRDIVNEDGVSIEDDLSDGIYHFSYGGGEGEIYITDCENLQMVADGLNFRNQQYSRKYTNVYNGSYNGYYTAKAVDIKDLGSKMQVNNTLSGVLAGKEDLDAFLQADDTGIWVQDAAGSVMSNSKKTWEDMGIRSWTSLNDISDAKEYEYTYDQDGYDIKFQFTLLDETSLQSVIQGINNAAIRDTRTVANNATVLEFTSGGALVNGVIKAGSNHLTIYEEAALGRDFDVQSSDIQSVNMVYDADSDSFSLAFSNVSSGETELGYASVSTTNKATIQRNAQVYLEYLSAREAQKLITGSPELSSRTLKDVLGDNVKANGYLSETIEITSDMNRTRNLSSGTHPGAVIDFSGLGTDYEWYDLLGTGYSSTCKTCNQHYSIMFTYGGTANTTTEGYGYTKTNDGQNNYTLNVDLNSLINNGVQNGQQLADALVNVMRQSGFDSHYTQYASDGSQFIICDNRSLSGQATNAKFDTEPYEVGNSVVDIRLKETSGNRYMDLQYTYDISSSATATAAAAADPDGEYVQDGSGGYKKYVSSDYYDDEGNLLAGITNPPERYNIVLTNSVTSWEDYYDSVMNDIAVNSKITLQSTDYDYISYAADENPNSAVVSTFDFKVVEDGPGFWIQSGANAGEGLAMYWDTFSTYSLGLSQNALTHESASELMTSVDEASKKISALRSTFGAYVNRMEYMYANNTNYTENLQSSESNIRDTDMAEEMLEFSKHSILEQAAQAMLAQANQQSQGVLQLLQG